MPGCGGLLPKLSLYIISRCLFLAAFSVFLSKSGSPALLERALLERAVGRSYWKEPALSRDWRKISILCECIGYHYIWRSGQDQCLFADRSVESPGRWKWRARTSSLFFFACVFGSFVLFLVRLFIICFLFVVSPDRVETDGRIRRRCLVLAGWDDSTTRLLMQWWFEFVPSSEVR